MLVSFLLYLKKWFVVAKLGISSFNICLSGNILYFNLLPISKDQKENNQPIKIMPSICFEAIAALWINTKKQIMREPMEQQVFTAQDNLEQCKRTMELREKELQENILKLAKEAVAKNKVGDKPAARLKLKERERFMKRLEKLRNSMNIIDLQLDAIRSSELDKEIMLSLKASTVAMKKAGISVNATEVENVMSELDDHVREMQDVTSILATPISGGMVNSMTEDEEELDQELERLMISTSTNQHGENEKGEKTPLASIRPSSSSSRVQPYPQRNIPEVISEQDAKDPMEQEDAERQEGQPLMMVAAV